MFENKTILVTGATSGIGFAITQDLLAAGANIIGVGRNTERLAQLKALHSDRIHPLAFDLTQFEYYREAFASIALIDGLVCSAGIANSNPLRFFSLEKYQQTVDINQTAPIALLAELARAGKLNKGASVVFISSILGPKIGRIGSAAYAATKAALTGFAKVAALELANKNIRVNCVSPGMVNTALAENQSEVSNEARQADMQRYPLGKRYAEPSEIASVVRFLLSSQSSFITGESLVVDGGFTTQ
jgi:NAD(P)-dependent dehydrogenase (short-subunit alcohol dehydrogenase family)